MANKKYSMLTSLIADPATKELISEKEYFKKYPEEKNKKSVNSKKNKKSLYDKALNAKIKSLLKGYSEAKKGGKESALKFITETKMPRPLREGMLETFKLDYKETPIKKAKGGWIQGAIKKPGALRKQLGVKQGDKIPKAKLDKAAKAPGKLGQRARLAKTLRGFRNGGMVTKWESRWG